MYPGGLSRIDEKLARKKKKKKRVVVKLVLLFPFSRAISPHLLLLSTCVTVFSNRSVLESGTRAYRTEAAICPFYYYGGHSPRAPGPNSLLRSRSRLSRSRESARIEKDAIGRSCVYVCTRATGMCPTGRVAIAFVPRLCAGTHGGI